ncbi:MAG: SemiSWEET transporter [Bacteroidota bacterium]|jgi:MtN3 and saliva related transmembrane protein|nr:SemiSWEET transporter [Bacteroidota bacterium]MEC7616815.1 SemiSWEET transporter [Bacteroidota bacterium]MED5362845.1 SemiSWEET transporter [Bacteroidota bacterium]|tara:strand:+ start:229 stop:489 length:261 start_codon:yes stop_codon:yes gene_type:complete
MIDQNELIGFIAAVCTTFAFLPQVIKVWKTKQTKDLSLRMYTVMFIGICLWFVYGLRINSLSIILANIVTGFLVFTILVYIFKNKE